MVESLEQEQEPISSEEKNSPENPPTKIGNEISNKTKCVLFPFDYKELTTEQKTRLGQCPINRLINYARAAFLTEDHEAIVLFQRELISRKDYGDENFNARIGSRVRLAIALEKLGRFQEALAEQNKVHELQPQFDRRNLAAILRLRKLVKQVNGANKTVELGKEKLPSTQSVGTNSPEAPKNSEIKSNRFDHFLMSLKRAALSWPVTENNEFMRSIPKQDRETMREAIIRMEEQLQAALQDEHAFLRSLAGLREDITKRWRVNFQQLTKLQERIPKRKIDWAEISNEPHPRD